MNPTLEKLRFVLVLLLAYTYIDIIAGKAWPYLNIRADVYFYAWEEVLIFLIVVLAVRFKNENPLTMILLATSLLLMARNGAEDFLYYVLLGQLPPSDLSMWLTGQLVFPRPATAFSTYFGAIWGSLFLVFASSKLPYRLENGFKVMVKKIL